MSLITPHGDAAKRIIKPSRAEPSRAEPSRAEPSRSHLPPRPPGRRIETVPFDTAVQPHRRHRPRPGTGASRGGSGGGADVAHPREQRLARSDDTASTGGNDHAQLFRTAGATNGYTLTSVTVVSEDAEGDAFDVEICAEDGTANEFPSTTASDCTALTAPASFTAGNLEFTHAGLALSANTNYVVVIKPRAGRERRDRLHHRRRRRFDRPLGVEHQELFLLEQQRHLDESVRDQRGTPNHR